MALLDRIFGARRAHAAETLSAPPPGVLWRSVRPRADTSAVRAWVADSDQAVAGAQGDLHARAGQDMIVAHEKGDQGVVRRDIFERTYEALGGGLYRKRDDVVLRYFTLDRPVIVETLEGGREAAPGDWIMQGVSGELWPVPRAKAEETYRSV